MKNKKLVAIVAVLTLSLAALAGCGKNASSGEEKRVLDENYTEASQQNVDLSDTPIVNTYFCYFDENYPSISSGFYLEEDGTLTYSTYDYGTLQGNCIVDEMNSKILFGDMVLYYYIDSNGSLTITQNNVATGIALSDKETFDKLLEKRPIADEKVVTEVPTEETAGSVEAEASGEDVVDEENVIE